MAPTYSPIGEGDQRIDLLLLQHPGTDPLACFLIGPNSAAADLARGVESTVFQEFFGNDPETLVSAYAPYETHSTWFLVADRIARRVAGVLRMIRNSRAGLKSLNDLALPPVGLHLDSVLEHHGLTSLDTCWDVGTLAVMPGYRGGAQLISTTLYGLFYQEWFASAEHGVTILDQHAYRQLTEVFGVPFEPLGGAAPFKYIGSDMSFPVYAEASKIRSAVDRHVERMPPEVRDVVQPLARRVFHGEGLPEFFHAG